MNFSGTEFTNKKKRAWLKILLILTILFGLIFALNVFSSQIKNSIHVLSTPIQTLASFSGKSSSNWIGSLLNSGNLSQENKRLEEENQKLLSEISELRSIQAGNIALSTISKTCQSKNFTTIMAGITGLDSEDTLTLNKGFDDGIREGMPVINQYNVLYGKIIKVYKNFSQVVLISNKNSIVNIQIQRQNNEIPEIDFETLEIEEEIPTIKTVTETENLNVNGVIRGNGGLSIYLDLVPVDDQINKDDILITSAIDQIFPKDILVGKIIEIQKNDQKPFQQATIDPFFDLNSTDNLFIITDYK